MDSVSCSWNAEDIRNQISLVDLLTRLGYHPVKPSGNELLYFSMLVIPGRKPSFKVNEDLNIWYDTDMRKGGDVIDFGLLFWNLRLQDTLIKIRALFSGAEQQPERPLKRRLRSAVKIPHYQIQEIKKVGNHPGISEYLKERGIGNLSGCELKEVYYYVENAKKLRKYFSATGWQNELGGWEIISKYFRGCIGHRGLTFIPDDAGRLSVFGDYLDYLSWKAMNPEVRDSALVLNTPSLLQAGIRKAAEFPFIAIYFNRDETGFQATMTFIKVLKQAEDRSSAYAGLSNYNQQLCSIHKLRQ